MNMRYLLLLIGCNVYLPFMSAFKYHRVMFDLPIIHFIDGIPGALDSDVIKDMISTWHYVHTLQYGSKQCDNHDSISPMMHDINMKVHDYQYDGVSVTLKDVVIYEDQFIKAKKNSDCDLYKSLNSCLQLMKDDFLSFSSGMIKHADIARHTNLKLIEEWTIKQKRENSHLLQWGTGSENELLKSMTAKDFFVFCSDLKHFLYDIMYSAPKARQLFKNAYLNESKWELFDNVFNKSDIK